MQDTQNNSLLFARDGIEKVEKYIPDALTNKLNNISNKITNFDMRMRLIGLGNRSFRNNTLFTGNLINKHSLYLELLDLLLPLGLEFIGDRCIVSEYKLVTSFGNQESSMWWHRDHPFSSTLEDRFTGTVGLGIFTPLGDFNSTVGSTYILPGTHKLQDIPEQYLEPDVTGEGVQLQAHQGDIFYYDTRLIHSGAPNFSSQKRNLILTTFTLPEFTPREDFKFQIANIGYPYKNGERFKRLLASYHTPDKNVFGVNRGWEHTSFAIFFRIFTKLVSLIKTPKTKLKYVIWKIITR